MKAVWDVTRFESEFGDYYEVYLELPNGRVYSGGDLTLLGAKRIALARLSAETAQTLEELEEKYLDAPEE